MTRPLRILTWHVHGNYLWYLSHVPHELVLPVRPGRPHGYGARGGALPLPGPLPEVPVDRPPLGPVDPLLFPAPPPLLRVPHPILFPPPLALPPILL